MQVGDKVRLSPPFDKSYPGEFTIVRASEGSFAIDLSGYEADFDPSLLQTTGKVDRDFIDAIGKEPTAEEKPKVSRVDIKQALWESDNPIDAIAALFGVKD